MSDIPDHKQELLDTFYMRHGKCCAGCDWWHWINSLVGECRRARPVSGHERMSMLGMRPSAPLDAGHIMTVRDHRCGEFTDTFDWESLPAAYLRRIGKIPA